ncbi:hypothetical protein [Myxococcus sp. AB025B]|uniref:hypothetical protein n=1 Tax=Myxococcus sp. AB025B TaxID=2562794 RepID=UPI00114163FF|nr:hypothetical protein [Myxococcus sp. AB025B]
MYSLDGEERWLGLLGDWMKDVATGSLGIAVLGSCEGPCPPDAQFGGTDGVLGLYSPTGTRLWTARYGPYHSAAWELTYHPTGAITLTGITDIDASTFTSKQLIQHLRPQ